MKRLLLSLAVVAVAATSCQKDFVENSNDTEIKVIEEQTSPYAVSEEEAIKRLNNFMSAFDGDETRSSGRNISSIASVKCNEINTTRSVQAVNAENLLYIVEFEDGQGSAIVGADERVEPVYAVLDNTALTIDDFNNAANGLKTDDIETITAGLIMDAAIQDITTCNILPNEDLRTDITYDTTYTTILEEVFPLLNTKWGRGFPYNLLYPTIPSLNTRKRVESSTIAVAQFINYICSKRSQNTFYIGDNHDMSIIRQFTHDAIIDDDDKRTILARYIFDICLHVGVGGVLNIENVINTDGIIMLLRDRLLPSTSGAYQTLNKNSVYSFISDETPVIVFGTHYDDDDPRYNCIQAWVLDGWKRINTQVIRTVEDLGIVISQQVISNVTVDYVHCNYGTDGSCDGYYEFGVFDTTRGRYGELIEEDCGDIRYNGAYIFENIYQF